MIIELVGKQGAGKSEICSILRDRNFHSIEISDTVRQLLPQNCDINKFTISMMRKNGKDVFARMAMDKIKHTNNDVTITVKSRTDSEYLRENLPNLFVVAVDVPIDVRLTRVLRKTKSSQDKPNTLKEFLKKEKDEIRLGINHVMESADHRLINIGSLEELKINVDKMIVFFRSIRT